MGNKKGITKQKAMEFSIRIYNLYKYLCENKKEFVLSKQILRSGTSIGANLSEAECAISENDFVSKIYISYKECSETLYWLELLKNIGLINQKEFNSINKDCEEIIKLLSATIQTMKSKKEKSDKK
ncbi:MAG: four helix bundle protein [Alphaproteobacteria bacterium]|nr:four helix bundle protein [Alphaproteobacteria bacterium]